MDSTLSFSLFENEEFYFRYDKPIRILAIPEAYKQKKVRCTKCRSPIKQAEYQVCQRCCLEEKKTIRCTTCKLHPVKLGHSVCQECFLNQRPKKYHIQTEWEQLKNERFSPYKK